MKLQALFSSTLAEDSHEISSLIFSEKMKMYFKNVICGSRDLRFQIYFEK